MTLLRGLEEVSNTFHFIEITNEFSITLNYLSFTQ
jgi:hypothetical protein